MPIQQIAHTTENDSDVVQTGSANPLPTSSRPSSDSVSDWSYAVGAPVANTSNVSLRSGTAGKRNILTAIQLKNTNAVPTEVVVKDGGIVIWRTHLNANMTQAEQFTFPTPLKTTTGNSLYFACITTGASVYVNAQGYQAS